MIRNERIHGKWIKICKSLNNNELLIPTLIDTFRETYFNLSDEKTLIGLSVLLARIIDESSIDFSLSNFLLRIDQHPKATSIQFHCTVLRELVKIIAKS